MDKPTRRVRSFLKISLEIIMRRYDRASTLMTSNRPVDEWGKLLGDAAAVMLDRLLHHGHVLKFLDLARTHGSEP